MPTYIYQCQECGGTLERRQSFSDAPLSTHDECGGSLRRLFYPAPVIFKGSGFYSTDYRSGSGSNGRSSGNSSASRADGSDSGSESRGDSSGQRAAGTGAAD